MSLLLPVINVNTSNDLSIWFVLIFVESKLTFFFCIFIYAHAACCIYFPRILLIMLLTIDFCCKLNCPLGTLKLYSIMSKLQANVATVNLCKSGHPKQPCSKWSPPRSAPATHLNKIRLTSISFTWYEQNKSLVWSANLFLWTSLFLVTTTDRSTTCCQHPILSALQ